MADSALDAVRKEFADLTALFEDAAILAAAAQGARRPREMRNRWRQLSRKVDRIRRGLADLERHLR